MPPALRLRLPATSANLGPGFDALGLAMDLHLHITAVAAPAFRIDATGRDAPLCAALENNLILDTYASILTAAHQSVAPLHLTLHNEIPLGMGCGSSAAALLAGVFLANHFGALHWTPQQILDEACNREGHPDNVAACFFGGMTSSMTIPSPHGPTTVAATFGLNLPWRLVLALPSASLSTSKARALLPPTYTRADAVANVQATALLVSAFALDRPDLLRFAMRDRLHQPFRSEVCPLLPRLLPLAGAGPVYGVALSGAGPSVLLLADPAADPVSTTRQIREAAEDPLTEILITRIATSAMVTSEQIVTW